MSFELQTLIVVAILIVGLVCAFGFLSGLFRKSKRKMIRYGLCLLFCVAAFYAALWVFNYQRIQGLVGTYTDFGDAVLEFGCCYDHHGDAIEVSIFKGNAIAYSKILPSNINSYPDEVLNINNHEFTQKWIPVSDLDELGGEVLRIATYAVEFAEDKHPEVEMLFSNILNHDATYISYIYNGNSRVYLWLINLELAQFVDITKY